MGLDIKLLTTTGPFVAYAIVFGFVFAESGLLVGFLLPGDSLLLTVGLLASHGYLNPLVLIVLIVVAAVIGDNVGYRFGRRLGPAILDRPGSRFFRRDLYEKAKAYYDRHGALTIAVARFIPYLRTFAPIVAGAVGMDYRLFFVFNVVGALAWGAGVTLIGYAAGSIFGQIAGFERYFGYVLIVGGLVTALLTLLHIWRENGSDLSAWLKSRMMPKGTANVGRSE